MKVSGEDLPSMVYWVVIVIERCDTQHIAPYPREPLTHCAWSRRQGVRAGTLSYHDPMFFRADRLVDRMSSGITPVRKKRMYYPGTEEAHTNPTRQRGECLRALAGASG